MSDTTHLALPYLAPSQAQKHVTHNEALTLLDGLVQAAVKSRTVSIPPASPVEGDRYLVAASPTGTWTGQAGKLAALMDGAWRFLAPREGWRLWVDDEDAFVVFDGAAWAGLGTPSELQNLDLLGVNATADATNKLSVASAATLFSHAGNGHQIKLNKNAAADTASILYQTGFSGRAEFGTTGDDDFHVKVSSDGAGFTEALVIAAASGLLTAKNGFRLEPQAADPASPVDGQVWYNSTGNSFRKRQNGTTTDLDTGGGGGVSDGDKGDVVVSGTGAVWTIDADVVSNAKLANMAANSIKLNNTGGAADPIDGTAAQARTLLNVADGATANSSDATLLARANHTGTQSASTISDFAEAVDDRVGALLVAGTNVTLTYNDGANTLTIDATGGGGGVSDGDKGDVIVSGSGATWKLDVNGATAVNPVGADEVLFGDVSDSNNAKKTTLKNLYRLIRRGAVNAGLYYFNDILNGVSLSTQIDGNLEHVVSGSGAGFAVQAAAASNRPGIVRNSTGTTATGRVAVMSSASAILLGGGELVMEAAVNVTTLSAAAQRFQLVIGLLDTNSAANQVDAAAFVYDEGGVSTGSTASANWQAVTESNSTRTWNSGASGSSAVAAATWVKLKIIVNAAGTQVDFYVDDTLRYSHSANIPTAAGRELGFGWLLIKSIGTTARTVDVDYIMVDQDFTTAR